MPKQALYLILHNIRSAHNVGSIFRTADGVGVSKIYLCGITPTPLKHFAVQNVRATDSSIMNRFSHPKIAKVALGAEKSVPWEYRKQTWRCLLEIKNQISNIKIVALEQNLKSQNIFKFKPKFPLALIVGNEVRGLNKKILSYADKIVEIPMYGQKESLNVAVATGIALYQLIETRK